MALRSYQAGQRVSGISALQNVVKNEGCVRLAGPEPVQES